MNIRMTALAFPAALDCFLCGERLEPAIEIAAAYTRTGVELGLVCSRCLESDPTRLRWRVQQHLGSLRQHLAVLEHLVSEEQVILTRYH